MNPKKKGMLITFEGGEGSGKSTQIQILYDALKREGRSVFLTREPGGTKLGEKIRDVLLDRKNASITPLCETLLYMASRAQIVEEIIRPELEKGKIVLCDRWLDATVAYQGYGAGVNVKWIEQVGKMTTGFVRPTMSLFFDLPVADGLGRLRGKRALDRMEKKSVYFHQKVRNGFLAIARREPGRFRRIPLQESDTIDQVHAKVMNILRDIL
ncbi:MAG: dTMP kinase [Candidatus Omnitrophica bacterium]|nr:dTMP kinase [Candidatus Omnitrophota bacterium]